MPAVNSGRSVSESPPRSSKVYISLETTSVRLAERAGEHLGRLEHRHLDVLEGVEPAHAVERGDDLRGSGRPPRRRCPGCPGPSADPCSSAAGLSGLLARVEERAAGPNAGRAAHEHRPHPRRRRSARRINVIIEVPVGGEPVKYEFDKKSGAIFVDRILHTPMRYPANYGFMPHTLSPDGASVAAHMPHGLDLRAADAERRRENGAESHRALRDRGVARRAHGTRRWAGGRGSMSTRYS